MSPWLPHFDRGILAYSEAGIYESFHVRGYEVQAPRQRFYQRPDLSEGNVALTVRQLTAAFALWGVGIAVAVLAVGGEAVGARWSSRV